MTNTTLASDWFIGVTSNEDRQKFEQHILNSYNDRVLKQIRKLVERKLISLDNSEMSRMSYENPSWAYEQAHKNGERSAYDYILNLINFVNKTEKS